MGTIDNLEYWHEWRERCALGLCTKSAQSKLRKFAGVHFRRYVDRYAHRTNVPNLKSPLSDQDAWHLFETCMTVKENRQGKRYKEWLFTRQGTSDEDPGKLLTSGTLLLMRDVVRDFLRREYSHWSMTQMSAPLAKHDVTLTVEDLLTDSIDPSDQVAQREFRLLADQYARNCWSSLNMRERLVLAAKARGQSLSSPEIQRSAGCKKSVLNETYHTLFNRLAREMTKHFATEDRATVKVLILRTFECLKELSAGHQQEAATQQLSVAERT